MNIRLVKGAIVLVVSLYWMSACVPTKRLTYLQYGDDLKGDNLIDTVLRSYEIKRKTFYLKPDDIISLRVASITENKYNFIKKYETDLGLIRKLDQYNRSIDQEGSNNSRLNSRLNLNSGDGVISSLILDRQNTGFTLDANGELELPEIGVLKLKGLTIPEAELVVKQALDGYYEAPMVRIQLLNYHFTVVGEVNTEGRFTTYDPTITIFDALSLAGDIGEFADRSNVKIIRNENGEAKVLYIDLLNEVTLNSENYFIQRNDVIVVPALEARTSQTYTIPNISKTLGWIGALTGILALVISLSR